MIPWLIGVPVFLLLVAVACITVVARRDGRQTRLQQQRRADVKSTGQRGRDWMGNEYPPIAPKAVQR